MHNTQLIPTASQVFRVKGQFFMTRSNHLTNDISAREPTVLRANQRDLPGCDGHANLGLGNRCASAPWFCW